MTLGDSLGVKRKGWFARWRCPHKHWTEHRVPKTPCGRRECMAVDCKYPDQRPTVFSICLDCGDTRRQR